MIRRLLAAGSLLLACDDLPEVTVVGAHVEVAADPGRQLCGGTLAHMDAFVRSMSAELSLPPPTGVDRVRYFWLENDDFHERAHCPRFSTACAHSGASFARAAPENHELAHNVAGVLGGPNPIFNEGIAVAFEGLRDQFNVWLVNNSVGLGLPNVDLYDLLTARSSERLTELDGYPVAGAFVAFLIRRHGLDAFTRAYAALGPAESVAQIDHVFRDELGEPLADSVAEFDATARTCRHEGYDAKLVECAAPELPWSGDVLVHHRTLDCADDDAVGPYDGNTTIVFQTLEIREAGGYELRALADAAVSLVPCAPCSGPEQVGASYLGPRTFWLAAGRYSVRLRGRANATTSVGFRLARVPGYPPPDSEE
ncbi:hypothetical protein [Nannocystis sp. SCPEA4]|uniref:hypothetical protein n=1 Tax=Nannocystis sp. SCPEA4 TaxID=2996787 RepID=UPI002271BF14|nr:hypothetical protein [Nannocystis sp. SCPEA4]MCY1062185.1 hypothetical protein [Nannocystis sp. SCPEA4]